MKEQIRNDGGRDLILKVMRSNETLVPEFVYDHGRSFDAAFMRSHPKHDWISNSVLWFGSTNTPADHKDNVIVVSKSRSPITFLTVNNHADSFLILDLHTGAKIVLRAEPQTDMRADISGFSCFALLMDGTTRTGGANFDIRGRYKGPAHYNIAVTDSGIDVTSDEFESIK